MLAKLMRGKEVLASNYSSDSIVRPDVRKETPKVVYGQPKVMLKRGDKVLATNVSTIGNTAKITEARPRQETVSQTIVIPSIWEEPKPVEEPVQTIQQTENATIVTQIYNDPEVFKADVATAIVVPEDETIAEEISQKFEAPKVEEVVPATPEYVEEKVEEAASKQDDEFPPNQWTNPPTFNKKPRRVIMDSSDNDSSGNFVQKRQRNPYRD